MGDRFVSDCLRHHPVFPNYEICLWLEIARFCGQFPPFSFRLSRSLCPFVVSLADFGLPSLHQKTPFLAAGFSSRE
jgi:hypothetical protein